jgi:hypothetical protein
VGSNHQIRPENFVGQYNKTAMRLQRATDTSGWPVFSEPYLLCYDELGIEFSGQYPGGLYFLFDDLALTHAPPKRLEIQATVIHGHTHKMEKTTTVAHGRHGRKTYFIIDTGCLCRVGSTMDVKRHVITHVPSGRARTDWAQGISLVNVVQGKFPLHEVEHAHIHEGASNYRGQLFQSRETKKKVA